MVGPVAQSGRVSALQAGGRGFKSHQVHFERRGRTMSAEIMTYKIDESREPSLSEATGIYIRAQRPDGRFDSVDIGVLTKDSLLDWLRSRGGSNPWAENTIGILLMHGALWDEPTSAWVSVKERMPELIKTAFFGGASKVVLVTDGKAMTVSFLMGSSGEWINQQAVEKQSIITSLWHYKVTHWMPLPELPQ